MGRRFQEHQLADAEAQEVAHGPGLPRQRFFQAMIDEGIDLAQAAQRGGHQVAGEGPVAIAQEGESAMVLDGHVEGPLAVEDRLDQIEGDGTGHG